MPAIGITGGVATGKSSFVRALLTHRELECFDADQCVHRLLAEDQSLQAELVAVLGDEVRGPDGGLDRPAMRRKVFDRPELRHRVEELLHPRVRAVWQPMARAARSPETRIVLFDIPLIYETAIEREFDRIVVVAASPDTQRRRMRENRSLASEVIEGMLKAQIDLPAKVARADHVVWNDCSPSALDAQARILADYFRELYG